MLLPPVQTNRMNPIETENRLVGCYFIRYGAPRDDGAGGSQLADGKRGSQTAGGLAVRVERLTRGYWGRKEF